MDLGWFDRRHAEGVAGFDVEFRSVPGAGDGAVGQRPVAERAAVVGADVVEGRNTTRRRELARRIARPTSTRNLTRVRYFADLGDGNEFAHGVN